MQKIKIDQGIKSLLRGLRICLKDLFKRSQIDRGKYHWTGDKLFEKTREFLERLFNSKEFTEQEISIMIVLLYPAKSIEESMRMT